MKFVSQYENFRLVVAVGEAYQFKKGIFETKNKALIEKLQSLPNYRKDFGPERKEDGVDEVKAEVAKPEKPAKEKTSEKDAKLKKEEVKN